MLLVGRVKPGHDNGRSRDFIQTLEGRNDDTSLATCPYASAFGLERGMRLLSLLTPHPNPLTNGEGTRTTCPYCGVGCGVIATADGNGGAAIAGDPDHPANFGRLCSKGLALGETLGLETRVLHPLMRQPDGALAKVSWDAALDALASGFQLVLDRDGPEAIAFYLSGQLLTEDYYVANKLAKGFLGSANVDTNSRLCMASSVAGHRRAFGADVVPGCYEDLDEADLIVLVGSNAAWCHPVLFQRMLRNKRERGAKIIVIDPRRAPAVEDADLFLGIEPGMDSALFCGLFAHLAANGKEDTAFVSRHTSGFEEALANALEIAPSTEDTARATRLRQEDIALFFEWFANTDRTVTCYSQGVNQSAQGTDKVNAIINCHLLTGRIGKSGMGPFSLTGQPNAMGGREVGGLANQLAAHMGFAPEERDRVARFWNAPRVPHKEGLKAVQMFEAIEQGRIKALWVMGTNPVASLPRGEAMAKALAGLELFVVSDNVRSNDTINAGAHILLPAAAWGEKEGTVTNSERRISRQRAFLPMPGEARPDWWILSRVARRLGWDAEFAYESAADIFAEHAALSAFENDGSRAFDLSGLRLKARSDYDGIEPFQWPLPAHRDVKRLFAGGGFYTPDGKARFVGIEPPALASKTSPAFRLRLNTGRLRDQWHTMTRTGLSARLCAHSPEPWVQIHPQDAERFGVKNGGFARVSTEHGALIARAAFTGDQNEGSLFVPIHWNREFSEATRVSGLVAPFCDPHSGQPESKATPCAIGPASFKTVGFVLSRQAVSIFSGGAYTARTPVEGAHLTLFACDEAPDWIAARLRASLPPEADAAEYRDDEHGILRLAAACRGRIEVCFFAASDESGLPDRSATLAAMATAGRGKQGLTPLLSGGRGAPGALDKAICVCHGVKQSAIAAAIKGGCDSAGAVGERTKAGTNCGSCRPEINALLRVMAGEPSTWSFTPGC
jgi:assimilatory nitrate reductase catalytic subunit